MVWGPPSIPNGIILNYTVEVQISGSPPFISRMSADTTEALTGLDPATTYLVAVRGMTSGGTGEAALLTVTTLPCEWQYLFYTCILLSTHHIVCVSAFSSVTSEFVGNCKSISATDPVTTIQNLLC